MRRWWFSLSLLAIYIATFQLWLGQPREQVVTVGLSATVIMAMGFVVAQRTRYFVNRWDAAGHAAVILDVFLEGLLVSWHPDRSFYWCAAAFVLVLGGYRAIQHQKPIALR